MLDARIRAFGRGVLDRHPEFEDHLVAARAAYETLYVSRTRLLNAIRHEAPVSPLELLRVDPEDVTYVAGNFYLPKYRRVGAVRGGSWDRHTQRFENTVVHRALEAHWVRGVDWRDTAYYHRAIDGIKRGERPWNCESVEEFEDRCNRLDVLFDRIKDRGYRTQRELNENDSADPLDRSRPTLIQRILNDEVAVDIGRHGELLFSDGRHRLSIAKILELDRIPVLVLVRHTAWQTFRDRVAAGQVDLDRLGPSYRSHPDMQSIV